MGELTLQDLLDSGISLEELLFNKDPVEVNVTVDTNELNTLVGQSHADQTAMLNGIKQVITKNNQDNKEFLVKALSFLIKDEKGKNLQANKIKGIKVIRDKEGRLDEFRFIREK